MMTEGVESVPGSTREALLAAGLQLIARRGFSAVTVGDIEEAAGFVRRGGTLYKHFDSKAALLDEAMRRIVESLGQADGLAALLPLPDLRSELILIGKWMLGRLNGEETISRIVEQEGARLPGLVTVMRDGLSDPGYQLMAAYLSRRGLTAADDPDATAVVLLGSLINLRRSAWTFGQPPLNLNDERVVSAWAEICLALLPARPPSG
jgi:AcrR family transcriptional regulator